MQNDVLSRMTAEGWGIDHIEEISGREAGFADRSNLALSEQSERLLAADNISLFRHQFEAIRQSMAEANVVITTSTASGKTLAFQIAGIEALAANAAAKILAIYPMRALVSEQENRWKDAIQKAEFPSDSVVRIDGGISVRNRDALLKKAKVVVVTPDILHAWMFSNLAKANIRSFLSNLRLIVVDEAHTYTGVFGSNSAYLFRRMLHAIRRLGGEARYIAASATMVEPEQHLEKLTGLSFVSIGEELNSAPKQPIKLALSNPPAGKDLLSSCAELMRFIVDRTEHNVITFVDSRKQTEHIAAIGDRVSDEDEGEDQTEGELWETVENLKAARIFPYRAGYEENDRKHIQTLLTSGKLRGVVSTSALELGIDIPHLDVAILVGVPSSATSLYQRIGRIGRHQPGLVIVVNDGSVISTAVFQKPDSMMKLPLSEGALYLENRRIQYIHALCLARIGGEADTLENSPESQDEFECLAACPESFSQMCKDERIGEIEVELQFMKAQAADDPNHAYPLRDVEAQFQVQYKRGPDDMGRGSLSYSQLMREAYPGAVYYYKAKPHRVYRVNTSTRRVDVRHERQYTTKPINLPTLIFPNLSEGNVEIFNTFGELRVVECNLQISNAVTGYQERRGPNTLKIEYPLDPNKGVYFDRDRFTRNYSTTGVIISHPALSNSEVKLNLISELIYEAFLMTIPYERRDVGYGDDRIRKDREPFTTDDRFISIYDQTYGSLRLTSHLADSEVLKQVLSRCLELVKMDDRFSLDETTRVAVQELYESSLDEPVERQEVEDDSDTVGEDTVHVIMPGSYGISRQKGNEFFNVESVFFSPKLGCVAYKGFHESEERRRKGWPGNSSATTIVRSTEVEEVPGESKMGLYDLNTGETAHLD